MQGYDNSNYCVNDSYENMHSCLEEHPDLIFTS